MYLHFLQVCVWYTDTLGCEVCPVVQFNTKDGQRKVDDVGCLMRDVGLFLKFCTFRIFYTTSVALVNTVAFENCM